MDSSIEESSGNNLSEYNSECKEENSQQIKVRYFFFV